MESHMTDDLNFQREMAKSLRLRKKEELTLRLIGVMSGVSLTTFVTLVGLYKVLFQTASPFA